MTLKKHVSLNINVRGSSPRRPSPSTRGASSLKAKERVANLGLGQSPFPVPTPVVNALRLYASRRTTSQ